MTMRLFDLHLSSRATFTNVVYGVLLTSFLPQDSTSCSIQSGIEYTKPNHYKEYHNITTISACCDACVADGANCGSWKLCKYSTGLSCRLLSTAPMQTNKNTRCTSGTQPTSPPPPPPPGVCDPRHYGAKGDGKTVDTAAINAAIVACDSVVLSGGTFVSGTILLKSNLILLIEQDAVLKAAPKGGHHFGPVENNPFDAYQDYGHSHWKDSMIYGKGVVNVTITGSGFITGGGSLSEGEPHVGDGCKMIGLVSCAHVTITDVSMEHGGWFTLLATNITGLTITGITVAAARDAFDIVSCRHVRIDNVHVYGGGDDAMALKSDVSTGVVLPSFDINITNSVIGSNGCNALQFGSETAGPFSDILWENITVTAAGKAGISIVSMDGSNVTRVRYSNITMSNTVTPFYFYIGARMRRPGGFNNTVGGISQISIVNVHGTKLQGSRGNHTGTFDGQPMNKTIGVNTRYPIGPQISLINVSLHYEGGGNAADVDLEPPHPEAEFAPRYLGVRPSYGFYIRNTIGVTLQSVHVSSETPDGRPAFIVEDDSDITFDDVQAERGTGQPWDIGVKKSDHVSVEDSNLVVKNF